MNLNFLEICWLTRENSRRKNISDIQGYWCLPLQASYFENNIFIFFWRRRTFHSNIRPVSTWRHQQMAIRQDNLTPCSRAQRSERRRRTSFCSTGNAYDAISSSVVEGWNRVAQWRIPQRVDPRSRGIGCTQGSNHLVWVMARTVLL